MSKVYEGSYKDVKALLLENEILKVTIMPDWGSKLSSIIYKPLGHELLWQNPSKNFIKNKYEDNYIMGEFAGFDEMFPSIDRFFYEDFPWAGIEVPDHGEVWALPWSYKIEDNLLIMSVFGIRFPYQLKKTVELSENCIQINYTVKNHSPFKFSYIWAAHPLFNTVEDMEFIVPEGMNKIVNAYQSVTLGSYGKPYSFPLDLKTDGSEINMSIVPKKNDFGYQKYFFIEKVTEGWCFLYNPEEQLNIGLSYPLKKVSYLGMWLNEGGRAEQYNIAPEPATGGMDRVDLSKKWNMSSVLSPYEESSWYLYITVKEGKRAQKMDEKGNFYN